MKEGGFHQNISHKFELPKQNNKAEISGNEALYSLKLFNWKWNKFSSSSACGDINNTVSLGGDTCD